VRSPEFNAFNSLVVMAADSMLRGRNGRKLEAGDFTTFTTFYVEADYRGSASLWRLRLPVLP